MKGSGTDLALENEIVRASETGLWQSNGTSCIDVVVKDIIIIKGRIHNDLILTH